ncbi:MULTISPECIES: cysteine peptidase family C39 domain-containing protein [Methanothermobacter]|jgi:predicted double-glycine peptidase|uniref:Peptidase C39 domain-containing protein n=1 Tax=Methanothermobacter thermautotrophicus (strain ATCC 29096 / DSM 1053 / JCM 10044 / NBRC 100330 / Delta H) TaxID=187420 RepID=O27387_METTH|nr:MULTISPECIES: C39 family peptidase [Methanothermobacter]AAB85810.1 unknown [Methanothermobacter thermautotrophicus str. Delta H]BAZ99336.1 hypothetical protein tca_01286 [Methanothermobacter sp. EMTCatA1]
MTPEDTINDGTGHYTVINGITNDTVKLADPSLGNIEMNIEEFAEIYSGYALVINDPNNPQVNGTTEQTNNQTDQSNENTSSETINNLTDTASAVKADNRTLTDEEMKNIKGKNWKYRLNQRLKRQGRWKRNAWYNRSFNWWRVYYGGAWVCVAPGYTNHPVGKLFGFLGTVYLGTVGTAHLNEGWWTYT